LTVLKPVVFLGLADLEIESTRTFWLPTSPMRMLRASPGLLLNVFTGTSPRFATGVFVVGAAKIRLATESDISVGASGATGTATGSAFAVVVVAGF